MVVGSCAPVLTLNRMIYCRGVAQLVARHVRDVEVAGSSPVTPIQHLTRCIVVMMSDGDF